MSWLSALGTTATGALGSGAAGALAGAGSALGGMGSALGGMGATALGNALGSAGGALSGASGALNGGLGSAGMSALGGAIPAGTTFAGPGAASAAEMAILQPQVGTYGPGFNMSDIMNAAMGLSQLGTASQMPPPVAMPPAVPMHQLLGQQLQTAQQRQPSQVGPTLVDYIRMMRGY